MNDVSRSLVRMLASATGAKRLTARAEDTATWVVMIGLIPYVLHLIINLLVILGVISRSTFTDDVLFYSRVTVGSGLLAFGVTMAARRGNRFVIRLCLIGAAIILTWPILELLTVILGWPSIR